MCKWLSKEPVTAPEAEHQTKQCSCQFSHSKVLHSKYVSNNSVMILHPSSPDFRSITCSSDNHHVFLLNNSMQSIGCVVIILLVDYFILFLIDEMSIFMCNTNCSTTQNLIELLS